MHWSVMDSASSSALKSLISCCGCNCSYTTWHRSVKRKLELISEECDFPVPFSPSVARVEIENECIALREVLTQQQQVIQKLYAELEEERNASASAATEAMSMILRLQREKAEAQMEVRQYKRFAEEKMAHDQQELLSFEDLLYKKDQVIQSLNYEVRAYKHRLMSIGYSEAEAEAVVTEMSMGTGRSGHVHSHSVEEDFETQVDASPFVDYPPLRCNLNDNPNSPALIDGSPFHIDKHAFGETPHAWVQLQDLDFRINQLERTPRHNQMDGEHSSMRRFLEKVAAGPSPRQPRHSMRLSMDSFRQSCSLAREKDKDWNTIGSPRIFRLGSMKKMEDFKRMEDFCSSRKVNNASRNVDNASRKADSASDLKDDTTERICTIDSIQDVPINSMTENKASISVCKDYATTPRESLARVDTGEMDVEKLYMRLQALEAERDSMRQEFISMKTDQARLIFMKALARQLSQDMSAERHMSVEPEKPSPDKCSSSTYVLKWVTSFVSWRTKAHRARYMCGQSENNVGLLALLDQKPQLRQLRCLTRTSAT